MTRPDPEAAWAALDDALQEYDPPCKGDPLYTTDERLTPDDLALMGSLCASCDVLIECHAYATAAKVQAGYWAGRKYGRTPRITRKTTDAGAVSPAPITTSKEHTS